MQNLEDKGENIVFWKNLILVSSFFLITPVTILTSLFSLFTLNQTEIQKPEKQLELSTNFLSSSGVSIYASLPASKPSVSESIEVKDARPEIIKNYLVRYDSVLEPHAEQIVEIADKYGLDFRLITAIAQQESNLCKFIPPGGYNCWGWGIHSEGTLGFNSFPEAIETVSFGLKTEYLDKGFVTPEQIMGKYTPLSNGSWAIGVTQFMSEME